MNDLMVASSEADARAAEAVVAHHAAMAGTLTTLTTALTAATRTGRPEDVEQARAALVGWCRTELAPHALAEEKTLYPAAADRPGAGLLVTAMLAEHELMLGLVDDLDRVQDGLTAAVVAGSLRTAFESHLGKENDLILPLLATAGDVSLAGLLDRMHEEFGSAAEDAGHEPAAHGSGHEHACGCGEVDPEGYPELDARTVPHAIRHATIFGALDAVRPGNGLVLVAPHDPLPLLAQLEQREPDTFTFDYLERGPEAWRIAIVRRSA